MNKVFQKPGVYCLKAVNSKLIYIGSSDNLLVRRTVHFSNIKHQRINKGCKAMIDASINGDEIVFEVIEYCDSYIDREQYWINFYKQQDSYRLVNQFDAERNGSSIPDSFRATMSSVLKDRWKDSNYRSIAIERLKPTMFSAETLSKVVHVFNSDGKHWRSYRSAKEAAYYEKESPVSVAAAARGKYRGKFTLKQRIFIYNVMVLNKLDELLEAHPELRVISSQAWEACKSYQEGSETNG